MRIASFEISELVKLVNAGLPARAAPIRASDVRQFIVGITDPGEIVIPISDQECAVIVAIEQFNVDSTAAQTTKLQLGAETTMTKEVPSQWATGDDLFYVFPSGTGKIILTATAVGTYYARALGYYLPQRAYAALSRMGTKVL
jgi:hypothetical protein